ncbi:hypothetical protein HDU97_004083 [Phlyctochytrium planicorne]|nr:hypothetical protein HDU97_004083 [Phlyctochytrium planicorne]
MDECGWLSGGRRMACSQPRRIAATSLANRVSSEMSCRMGSAVGYSVRFEDCTSDETRIKYLTDGMLFREILLDPLLKKYGIIMIDEAHERGLYTVRILRKRDDLRIIISSATLDAQIFKAFFEDSGDITVTVLSVEGRVYPVDIQYLAEPCESYITKGLETVFAIHKYEKGGDVLLFLTGKEEVDHVVSAINERSFDSNGKILVALPLYGGLPLDMQNKVFDPDTRGIRRVIVSTNIAEASVTVPNITFVIDCGFVKIQAQTGFFQRLITVAISQSSAKQRAGRAGRTAPGKVFRLYTESAYKNLPQHGVPEIQRIDLTQVQLKALGVENVLRFDYLTPPSSNALTQALEVLYSLKALDDYGRLTLPFGAQIAELPLPPLAAAMAFVDNNSSERWCEKHYLDYRALKRAKVIKTNLQNYLKREIVRMDGLASILEKIAQAETPEKKEQIEFQWLYLLEKDLSTCEEKNLVEVQANIEKVLLQLVTTTSPRPTRPVRQTIGRAFSTIFKHGETRSLFDCIANMHTQFNNKKLDDLAIIHCVGALSESVGEKVLSLYPESAAIFIKALKLTKDTEVGLRHEAMKSLARSLPTGGKTLSDAMVKEMIKLGKAGLADKNLAIRSASTKLLQSCYKSCTLIKHSKVEEIEALVVSFLKAVEGSNLVLRRDIASLVASVFSVSFLANSDKPAAANDRKAPVVFNLDDAFSILGNCLVKATTRETKDTIFLSYIETIRSLGISVLESNYLLTVKHLLSLISNVKIAANSAESLLIKGYCNYISREILKAIAESSQVMALKDLCVAFLPSESEKQDGLNELQTVFVLEEISYILDILGAAALPVEENIVEPVLLLLHRPSRLVNILLSLCLRSLCLALPKNLPKLVDRLFNLLQKEITALNSDRNVDSSSKFYSIGCCLAAVVGVIPKHSLNISFDSVSSVFATSAQLLKLSQQVKDSKLSLNYMEVAWLLLGSLFSLGPNFVRVHLTQLLLIWKSSFPKVSSKDQSLSEGELLVAMASREFALAGLNSFLLFNGSELLSVDVAKRVVVYLNNVLAFVSSISTISQSPHMASKHKLLNAEYSLKMRLFSCFYNMRPLSSFETSFELLTKLTLETFLPDPESISDKTIIASNDKQLPSFEFCLNTSVDIHNLLADDDNSMVKSCEVLFNPGDLAPPSFLTGLPISQINYFDIDPHSSYMSNADGGHSFFPVNIEKLRPYSVVAVDNALSLFSLLFSSLSARSQLSILERISKIRKLVGGKVSAMRKSALQRNALVCVKGLLKNASSKKASISDEAITQSIRNFAEEFLVSPDATFRVLSSDILGRLSRTVSSGTFVNTLIQGLVDRIINVRDPDHRSGCAIALGFINSYVGGMASGSHLKTIVGILHSLASDPHALVHTWALQALSLVIESAGVMYGSYVNSTLSLVVKLFMAETHECYNTQSSSLIIPNLSIIFGKLLYNLIGVVGPELQMSAKVRELCYGLFQELRHDPDAFVVIEAVRCIQYFILFSPKHLDLHIIVPFLQEQLRNYGGNHAYLRKAAVTCLYQMAQKDPGLVLNAAAGRQLEEQLFALLDVETEEMVRSEIKDVITALLNYVVKETPSKWINICKSIVAKGGTSSSNLQLNLDAQDTNQNDDDDDSSLSKAAPARPPAGGKSSKSSKLAEAVLLLPRWKTQVFAIQCLRKIVVLLSTSGIAEHVDLITARASLSDAKTHDYLVFRLTDLVKIAFSCATATVYELRLEGLVLLKDVLEAFSASRDPEFQELALLEQYQAQISAALTPAFNDDAMPIVQALACRVCAVYVGSGINTDVASLSRVVRLLSGMLELSEGSAQKSSSNEAAILKIAALTAWSQLTLSSSKFQYLSSIVAPNLSRLVKSWFELLRDFARLKADLDALSPLSLLHNYDNSAQGTNMYIAATREVIVPFYRECWHTVMESFCFLIDSNLALVVNVLESQNVENSPSRVSILIGLCIESASSTNSGGDHKNANLAFKQLSMGTSSKEQQAVISLQCLRRLLRPELFPPSSFQVIFVELIVVLEKIIENGDGPLRAEAAQILKSVTSNFGDNIVANDPRNESQSVGINSWTKSNFLALWRVLMNSFMYQLPALSLNPMTAFYLSRASDQDRIRITSYLVDVMSEGIKIDKLDEKNLVMIIPQAMFIITEILDDSISSPELSNLLLQCTRTIVEKCRNLSPAVAKQICKPFQSFLGSLVDKLQVNMEEKDSTASQIRSLVMIISICFSSPSFLIESQELILRVCGSLTDLLALGGQFREIAIQGVRIIFSNISPTSNCHAALIRELTPALVAFVINDKDWIETELYQDIIKIFLGLGLALPKEYLIVLLKTMALFAGQDSLDSPKSRILAASLLHLAAKKQTDFRFALMAVSPDCRALTERLLKSLMATNAESTTTPKESEEDNPAPQKIKLKTFF